MVSNRRTEKGLRRIIRHASIGFAVIGGISLLLFIVSLLDPAFEFTPLLGWVFAIGLLSILLSIVFYLASFAD